MRLSRLGLLPVFMVARPRDVVLSAGVRGAPGVMGVSPMVLGEAGVGQNAEGVGVVSLLDVLWNEAASERDSPFGFERFKLSTGGNGVGENRGDDKGSLRGDSWTPCIDWTRPGVNDESPNGVVRDTIGLPSGGGEDDEVMVVVVMGMLSRRSPRPRRRALDRGAAQQVANSVVSASTSTSMGLACKVRTRLTGEGALTTRRGGIFAGQGRDRLPSTDEGERMLVGERMGRVARGERGEQWGDDMRKRAL